MLLTAYLEMFQLYVLLTRYFHVCNINRGSYMSARGLLNILNKLRKIDKMQGLPSISCLFRNKFNKFNNTGATNVRFYLSYDMKITLKSHFCRKNVIILSLCTQHCYDSLSFPENL